MYFCNYIVNFGHQIEPIINISFSLETFIFILTKSLESRERCEDENEYSSSSTATTTTTETSSSSYLDGFLNSLDEISKYLEKKCARVREQFQPDEISQSDLSITSTKASTDFYPYTPAKSNPPLNNNTQQIASNRRPRGARFATQPIHFIRSTFDDHFVNSSNIHSQKL